MYCRFQQVNGAKINNGHQTAATYMKQRNLSGPVDGHPAQPVQKSVMKLAKAVTTMKVAKTATNIPVAPSTRCLRAATGRTFTLQFAAIARIKKKWPITIAETISVPSIR